MAVFGTETRLPLAGERRHPNRLACSLFNSGIDLRKVETMPASHTVDAAHVCCELDALCTCLELHHWNISTQAEEHSHNHARCLIQLLGSDPRMISAASGRNLTRGYLAQLWHYLPWKLELEFGPEHFDPAWEMPTIESVAFLRKWLELIRESERPQRQYTLEKIPKGLLCKSLGISADKFQRNLKMDPLLQHPDSKRGDRSIRFDENALINTEIYLPSMLAAAVAAWGQGKTKAKKT